MKVQAFLVAALLLQLRGSLGGGLGPDGFRTFRAGFDLMADTSSSPTPSGGLSFGGSSTFATLGGSPAPASPAPSSGSSSSSSSASAPAGFVWETVTNAFCRGPNVLQSSVVKDQSSCEKACTGDSKCTEWTYCPASQSEGCDVLVYPKATQDASTENLPAGTCLTSYDKSQSDRAAYAFMVGTENAVLTTCGRLVPDDSSSSGDGGNGTCAVTADTAVVFPSDTYTVLDGLSNIKSAGDCCTACQETKGCTVFGYCHASASTCNIDYKDSSGKTQTIDYEGKIPPGACVLLDANPSTGTVVPAVGKAPWDYGTPKSGGSNPSSSPSPSKSPSSSGGSSSCTIKKNTFLFDDKATVAGGESNVKTAEDCCALCSQDSACSVFGWCRFTGTSCNFAVNGKTVDYDAQGISPGDCVFFTVSDPNKMVVASTSAPWDFGLPN